MKTIYLYHDDEIMYSNFGKDEEEQINPNIEITEDEFYMILNSYCLDDVPYYLEFLIFERENIKYKSYYLRRIH